MNSFSSFAFGIHAFDSLIRVQCYDAEIRDTLSRYIFPPLLRSDSVPPTPDIDVHLKQDETGTCILLNEELLVSGIPHQDVALATVKALDEAVVHRLKNFRAVHAGAVLVEGSAVLFPGSTHAGKSTLVAELLRRGASCFSDEYAIIDGNGRVHPYPRPLLLRDGSPQQSLVLPEELNSRFVTAPTPVGWILAIDFVQRGEWNIHQISQSEAMTLLLRNTPHEMAESPQLFDFFLQAVSNVTCFSGRRGDAAQAAEKILQLVAASSSSAGFREHSRL